MEDIQPYLITAIHKGLKRISGRPNIIIALRSWTWVAGVYAITANHTHKAHRDRFCSVDRNM